MNQKFILSIISSLSLIIIFPKAFATTCIEAGTCMPTNPLDVLNIYDVTYGSGMTLMVMALILGTITVAIYIRNRSLVMLSVLGIYEIATFGAILTSKYISSQYHIAEYVIILGAATGAIMLILRLVKE